MRSNRIAAVETLKAAAVPWLKSEIIANIPPSTRPTPPPVKGTTVNKASPRAIKNAAVTMWSVFPLIRLSASAMKKKRSALQAHTPNVSPVSVGTRLNEPSVPAWKWS